jgi:hypothetical protein
MGRNPVVINIPRQIPFQMARIVAEAIVEAKLGQTRRLRRKIIGLSATFAVALYQRIAQSVTPIPGTTEAILSLVRTVNEVALGAAPAEAHRLDVCTPAALLAMTGDQWDQAANDLAAILRLLYRNRTFMEYIFDRSIY